MTRSGIYIASKVVHAPLWRTLREQGAPIISTWIDEAKKGETKDYNDLWRRCIEETGKAERLILYARPHEKLTSALLEMGAAWGAGTPIFIVGKHAQLEKFRGLKNINFTDTMFNAMMMPVDLEKLVEDSKKFTLRSDICKCGHEEYYHAHVLGCNILNCRCDKFFKAPEGHPLEQWQVDEEEQAKIDVCVCGHSIQFHRFHCGTCEKCECLGYDKKPNTLPDWVIKIQELKPLYELFEKNKSQRLHTDHLICPCISCRGLRILDNINAEKVKK